MSEIGGLWTGLLKAGVIVSSIFVFDMFTANVLSHLYRVKTEDPSIMFKQQKWKLKQQGDKYEDEPSELKNPRSKEKNMFDNPSIAY